MLSEVTQALQGGKGQLPDFPDLITQDLKSAQVTNRVFEEARIAL
jgi:hypothetical protein